MPAHGTAYRAQPPHRLSGPMVHRRPRARPAPPSLGGPPAASTAPKALRPTTLPPRPSSGHSFARADRRRAEGVGLPRTSVRRDDALRRRVLARREGVLAGESAALRLPPATPPRSSYGAGGAGGAAPRGGRVPPRPLSARRAPSLPRAERNARQGGSARGYVAQAGSSSSSSLSAAAAAAAGEGAPQRRTPPAAAAAAGDGLAVGTTGCGGFRVFFRRSHSGSSDGDSRGERCDKCDSTSHRTALCPHYRKAREAHPDARAQRSLSAACSGGDFVLRRAEVVPQPGDGSCLFHSLAFGLDDGASALQLRQRIGRFILENHALPVADTPIRDWIRWDSGRDVRSYVRHMARPGAWGGGIEMAAFSRMAKRNVHVYERTAAGLGGFKRISCFDCPGAGSNTVHVLYCGGVHYDALRTRP